MYPIGFGDKRPRRLLSEAESKAYGRKTKTNHNRGVLVVRNIARMCARQKARENDTDGTVPKTHLLPLRSGRTKTTLRWAKKISTGAGGMISMLTFKQKAGIGNRQIYTCAGPLCRGGLRKRGPVDK